MKKTKFQQDFNRASAIEITKIFHPDLTDEQIEKNIKYGAGSYCWCQISFKVKDYGAIDIGISNYNCHTLRGRVTRQQMIEAKERGEITFHVWRFSMDKLSEKEEYGSLERLELENKATEILKKNYKIMPIEEFFNQYYDD